MTEIPVLAVRQPWASLIAEGHKTIEVRSTNTLKRGQIAIYASRTNAREDEAIYFYLNDYLDKSKSLQYGKIIAIANLYNVLKPHCMGDFTAHNDRHLCNDEYYKQGKTFFWYLSDIQQVKPVEFKASSVIWSKIDDSKLKVV